MNESDHHIHDQIAENERWLASMETPPAPAEAVARAKAAARQELLRMHMQQVRRPRVWYGVVGAAAALGLAVGVGWYATRNTSVQDVPIAVIEPEPVLDGIPEAAGDETTQLAYFDDSLSELEEWSSPENWSAGGASLFEAMNDAFNDGGDAAPKSKGGNGQKESKS